MKVTYIYHSCYAIEWDKFSIIVDFYKDIKMTEEVGFFVEDYLLKKENDLYVLCSHSHYDHFNPEIFLWQQKKKNIKYIFSKELAQNKKITSSDVYFLDRLEIFEDKNIKIQAFGSTDIGGSFLINAYEKQLFHAGDLNNWHWMEEVSKEEAFTYENNYLCELELLAENVDSLYLAMFPIDPRLGEKYMLGAEQFVTRIKTAYFLPMHFGEDYNKANAFAEYAKEHGCKLLSLSHQGQSFEL